MENLNPQGPSQEPLTAIGLTMETPGYGDPSKTLSKPPGKWNAIALPVARCRVDHGDPELMGTLNPWGPPTRPPQSHRVDYGDPQPMEIVSPCGPPKDPLSHRVDYGEPLQDATAEAGHSLWQGLVVTHVGSRCGTGAPQCPPTDLRSSSSPCAS